MHPVTLTDGRRGGFAILCLGSHCDDIEIGCGGTLLKLLAERPDVAIHWVVFSSDPIRAREAARSAELFLAGAREKQVVIKDFRDGFLPYVGGGVKEVFENLKRIIRPDLIFTHYRHDLHQDHRLISDLTWNTFRDQLILEYEIPKYDGDLGAPNLFVHLEGAICRRKVSYIVKSFQSQRRRQWFGRETFMSLLRMRGIESNATARYAEAFYCRKAVFGGFTGPLRLPRNGVAKTDHEPSPARG